MNLSMGSHEFENVEIPLLWGSRAVVQDSKGRLSVIDLEGVTPKAEIIGDQPAPGVEFYPSTEGFVIVKDNVELYAYDPYDPEGKLLLDRGLGLPDCHISSSRIRVGSNTFSGGMISGSGVGIAVTEDSISMGAPLPRQLAKLAV